VTQGAPEDLRVAIMRSRYGTWVFPKGGIEEGETAAEAALREVGEEIGLAELAPRTSSRSAAGAITRQLTGSSSRHRRRRRCDTVLRRERSMPDG
jgi:8-oxo-dGTP pyrophosphatase MutT (NUDIX family)